MKIAVIIDLWHPVTGGSQTHVRELSGKLIDNYDCRVDIFTRSLLWEDSKKYDSCKKGINGKLRVWRFGPRTKLSSFFGRTITIFSIAAKIIRADKKENYDLIHAHSILGGLIGKIASLFTKKPVLLTVHGSMNTDRGIKNFDYFIEKWILTKIRYDRVISVAKGFLKHENVNKNIKIIPNGVTIKNFDLIKDVSKADFFKILFVGRLHWQKGIDTLIEAVKILKDKEGPLLKRGKVQLHLIGYGFDISKYKKMVRRYGLDELIIFRGKISGDELIREYKSSHIFILPSLCEGQPVTFLEAMASKLPILTTTAADNAEIINPDFGWKIKENSPAELAEKISELIRLPKSSLAEAGQKGYSRLKESHTWDIIAGKTFDIYSSLT